MFQNLLLSRTKIQRKTAMNSKMMKKEDPSLWINEFWENGCDKQTGCFLALK